MDQLEVYKLKVQKLETNKYDFFEPYTLVHHLHNLVWRTLLSSPGLLVAKHCREFQKQAPGHMFARTVDRKDIPEELAYRKSRLINFICIFHLFSMKQVSNFEIIQ